MFTGSFPEVFVFSWVLCNLCSSKTSFHAGHVWSTWICSWSVHVTEHWPINQSDSQWCVCLCVCCAGMNAAVRAVTRMGIYVGAKVYLIYEVCDVASHTLKCPWGCVILLTSWMFLSGLSRAGGRRRSHQTRQLAERHQHHSTCECETYVRSVRIDSRVYSVVEILCDIASVTLSSLSELMIISHGSMLSSVLLCSVLIACDSGHVSEFYLCVLKGLVNQI